MNSLLHPVSHLCNLRRGRIFLRLRAVPVRYTSCKLLEQALSVQSEDGDTIYSSSGTVICRVAAMPERPFRGTKSVRFHSNKDSHGFPIDRGRERGKVIVRQT